MAFKNYDAVGAAEAAPSSRLLGDRLSPNQPLSNVYRQFEKAEALADRAEKLVNQLIGTPPRAAQAGGGAEPVSNGELYALADRARYVESRLDEAHEALSRLFDTL